MGKNQLDYRDLPVDDLDIVDWNPNQMPPDKFNALVNTIQSDGYLEPIVVAPRGDRFVVVGGAHRLEAVRMLGWEEVPAIVREMDEDQIKFQNMRLNVIKGKIDPQKFTELYEELQERYAEEDVAELLGITSKSELDKMIVHYSENLPDDLKDAFNKSKQSIKTMDDLVKVLNDLFAKQGKNLELFGYMIFDYDGKRTVWVRLDKSDYEAAKKVMGLCVHYSVSFDSVVRNALQSIAQMDSDEQDEHFEALPTIELPDNMEDIDPTEEELSSIDDLI